MTNFTTRSAVRMSKEWISQFCSGIGAAARITMTKKRRSIDGSGKSGNSSNKNKFLQTRLPRYEVTVGFIAASRCLFHAVMTIKPSSSAWNRRWLTDDDIGGRIHEGLRRRSFGHSRFLMSTASSRNEAPSLPVDCFFNRIARIAESFS